MPNVRIFTETSGSTSKHEKGSQMSINIRQLLAIKKHECAQGHARHQLIKEKDLLIRKKHSPKKEK